jgi:hypothetical protein
MNVSLSAETLMVCQHFYPSTMKLVLISYSTPNLSLSLVFVWKVTVVTTHIVQVSFAFVIDSLKY